MYLLNAVFEGGGVKGVGLVGALSRLRKKEVYFQTIVGTSAGSIVAALLAAGYPTHELRKLLDDKDFSELLYPTGFWWWYRLLKQCGIHKSDKLYEWVYELLEAQGIVTFRDVRGRGVRLKIVASDLTNKRILVFDSEDDNFLTTQVADAVRMSASIPLFFEAALYKKTNSLVVDGGILSNYALWLCKDSDVPTIGFKLVSEGENPTEYQEPKKQDVTTPKFIGFLLALLNTMMVAHDKRDMERVEAASTIHIPTCGIGTTDFSLSSQQKDMLFKSGFFAAEEFLESNEGRQLMSLAAGSAARTFPERVRSDTENESRLVPRPITQHTPRRRVSE